jgi:hypothetical protein
VLFVAPASTKTLTARIATKILDMETMEFVNRVQDAVIDGERGLHSLWETQHLVCQKLPDGNIAPYEIKVDGKFVRRQAATMSGEDRQLVELRDWIIDKTQMRVPGGNVSAQTAIPLGHADIQYMEDRFPRRIQIFEEHRNSQARVCGHECCLMNPFFVLLLCVQSTFVYEVSKHLVGWWRDMFAVY